MSAHDEWSPMIGTDGRGFWFRRGESGDTWYQPHDWRGLKFRSTADLKGYIASQRDPPMNTSKSFGVNMASLKSYPPGITGTAIGQAPPKPVPRAPEVTEWSAGVVVAVVLVLALVGKVLYERGRA